jgi:glycosyltransferase involved in cell wall biosynthesis
MIKYPRITVVTPSFNQAAFLERTIRSVLDQQYPDLEYIVIDGGSTDGSQDIIRRYADRLAWWVSEPDEGQADAINKGLQRATGEWIAWQNSDDVYLPGAFEALARAAVKHPRAALILGDLMLIDEHDQGLRDICYVKPSYRSLLAEGMVIANQAAFWRRDVHAEIGYIDPSMTCSFDYEWFLRLTERVDSAHVNEIWGALRLHGETKTHQLAHRFLEENRRILAGRESSAWEKKLYALRRLILMLRYGKLDYVARGVLRRTRGWHGEAR